MRYVVAGIVVLIVLLQYRLWFAEGGMRDLWRLRDQVAQQQQEIEQLIKEHETFFRVIRRPQAASPQDGEGDSPNPQ